MGPFVPSKQRIGKLVPIYFWKFQICRSLKIILSCETFYPQACFLALWPTSSSFGNQIVKRLVLLVFLFAVLSFQAAIAQSPQKGQAKSDAPKASKPKPSGRDLAFFETKVRPLLVAKCYQCHSSKENAAEGGLLVDSRDALLQGGDGGPAVVVGDSKASLLLKAIEYNDSDFAMPPPDAGGKMSADEIETIAKWIQMGLPDSRKRTTTGHDAQDYREIKKWWSFQPMKQPVVPGKETVAVNDSQKPWSTSEIDLFVDDVRAAKELRPGPDASPETLVRRVYFDLIGLPPSGDELSKFEKEVATAGFEKAFEVTVDLLLASPDFGVHWGRHWLDVARYAESSGREVNVNYPHAWRYRDWVIDAVNEDKPYDQFLREQIAGDLLPSNSPKKQADNMIATGFLAVGSRALNEMNPKQFEVDQADEQIDTVFQATMGLTVGCARCHDHKFDPIPQTDYTAVAGVFLSTKTHFGGTSGRQDRNVTDLLALPIGSGQKVLIDPKTREEITKLKGELLELGGELEKLRRSNIKAIVGTKAGEKSEPKIDRSTIRERNQLEQRRAELMTTLEQYDDQGQPLALAMGVTDKQPESKTTQKLRKAASKSGGNRRSSFTSIGNSPLFARGDIALPGEQIERGIPPTLGHSPKYDVPQKSSGRLELAKWITRDNNTFTSRVAVNRIWSNLIGQGFVTSLDNFGTTGSVPSHPELLDYLALKFVSQGWSIKKVIREIVLSRTYRMGSNFDESSFAVDPDNAYLWRMNSKRLPGESIRDGILVASGALDKEPIVGSPIAETGAGRVDRAVQMLQRRYRGNQQQESSSRSIYLSLARGALPELLEIFDAPDANAVQGHRDTTNVPSQSLYMLNSPWIAAQSKLVAKQIIAAVPGKMAERADKRIEYAYRSILSRSPSAEERQLSKKLLGELGANPEIGLSSLARGLIASGEFRSID